MRKGKAKLNKNLEAEGENPEITKKFLLLIFCLSVCLFYQTVMTQDAFKTDIERNVCSRSATSADMTCYFDVVGHFPATETEMHHLDSVGHTDTGFSSCNIITTRKML